MTIQLNGKTPTKITMRKPGNNFATQGPCPDGFHVPTKNERQALVAAMTTLGIDTSNGNCMKTYMKIPFAGRLYSSNSPSDQGTLGVYWASNAPTGFFSYGGAYALKFVSSYLETYEVDRSDGCSVRPFKNTPVALSTADIDYFDPDTQWPVIPGYETLYWNNDGIAGIYRDDTNGIITLSSDGETWITIADKNLGATTVYNDGDTLSQSNCGNYFQWGNNYGFAWTGAVTTSSTMVDASGYGPGNYYSSSTFITGMGSPYDWSSVKNDNLWGGEDGNVPMLEEKEIKKIVVFPDGVTEKQIRPENIKEIYTMVAKTQSSGTAIDFVSIYKSGYTIKQVVIETTFNKVGTWCNSNFGIATNSTSSSSLYLNTNGIGNNNYCGIQYSVNGGNWQTYRNGLSGLNTGGNNTAKFTIGRDSATLELNGTTNSYTYGSSEATFVQGILDSATAQFIYNFTASAHGDVTITVTYN